MLVYLLCLFFAVSLVVKFSECCGGRAVSECGISTESTLAISSIRSLSSSVQLDDTGTAQEMLDKAIQVMQYMCHKMWTTLG